MTHKTSETHYASRYNTAKQISRLMSFFGWLAFVIGIISAIMGFHDATFGHKEGSTLWVAAILGFKDVSQENVVGYITLLSGIGLAFAGLLLAASGQITRAIVENSDHTREILRIMSEKA